MVERLPVGERPRHQSDASAHRHRTHGFQRFGDFARHGTGDAETVLHVFQRQAFTGRPFAVQHFDGQRATHCILQQFAAVFVSCHPQFLSLCVQIFFQVFATRRIRLPFA